MKSKKISVEELIQNLKELRRRPISMRDIEEFNKIVERDEAASSRRAKTKGVLR